MPFSPASRNQRPPTWGAYYAMWIVLLCFLLLIGPAVAFYGFYADHRDRPSLQWPEVSGSLVECRQVFHPDHGRDASPYYNVAVTYTYVVGNRSYSGQRIALWSRDFYCADGKRSSAFVSAHPAGRLIQISYDPEHPENAVLIPGPDVAGNRLLKVSGYIGLIGGIVVGCLSRPSLMRMKAKIQLAEKKHSAGVL